LYLPPLSGPLSLGGLVERPDSPLRPVVGYSVAAVRLEVPLWGQAGAAPVPRAREESLPASAHGLLADWNGSATLLLGPAALVAVR
jgi:hypothetical protein